MNETQKSDLNKKNTKNTEELVKAVKTLTLEFKKTNKDVKNASGKPAKGGLMGAILGNVMQSSGLGNLKSLTTPHGLMGMAAQKAGDGIVGTALATASEHVRERALAKEEKVKWASGYLSGTDKGRELVKEKGVDAAAKEALKILEEKQRLEQQILEIEERRATLKATGIEGADVDEKELETLKTKKDTISYLMKNGFDAPSPEKPKKSVPSPIPKPEASEEPKAEAPLSREQIGAFFLKKTAQESGQHFSNKGEEAEFLGGVRQGIEEELLALSEEQLDELRKLVKATEQSEEDRHEADRKSKASGDIQRIPTPAEIQKEEPKSGSMIDNVLSKVKGFKNIATKIPSMLGTAARFLGPAAAVAGAGYAGFKAGGLLNDYVLNPAAEAITGQKGATVGTALYDGVDKMKGMLGFETDAEKSRKIEEQARAQIAAAKAAKATAYRKEQTSALVTKTDAVANAKETAKEVVKQTSAAPTVVTTNNNTTMVVRPEVRTKEPSFNRVLQQNFSF